MIILGVDPGSRKAGYAFIEKQGRRFKFLASGVLHYDKEKDFLLRLAKIHQNFDELCQRYQPSQVAFESLIYVKSVTSLAKLAQARGAMIAACHWSADVGLFEYAPNTIKATVSGHGHASKEGLQQTLALYYGKLSYLTHDESDALAIATCHALSGGNKVRTQGQTLSQAFKHLAREST